MNFDFSTIAMTIAKGRPIITSQEEYLSAIDRLVNPTFSEVRELAKSYYMNMDQSTANAAYRAIGGGKVIISTIEQCAAYFFWFGKKHITNISKLYNNLPEDLFTEDQEIDLIDWGCGQGLATMLLCDFIEEKRTTIKTVTLIDPSSVALERAEIYVKKFLPDATVVSISQNFETISEKQFAHCSCTTHIHLFANIIDVPEINLPVLISLIQSICVEKNYFLCMNPAYQGDLRHCQMECQRVCRFNYFITSLKGKIIKYYCDYPASTGIQFSIVSK